MMIKQLKTGWYWFRKRNLEIDYLPAFVLQDNGEAIYKVFGDSDYKLLALTDADQWGNRIFNYNDNCYPDTGLLKGIDKW